MNELFSKEAPKYKLIVAHLFLFNVFFASIIIYKIKATNQNLYTWSTQIVIEKKTLKFLNFLPF